MTKRDDLFAAILANPDDDSVRLVYADHIEETGDAARGQLIHRQIELAKLAPWDRETRSLALACDALLTEHGARWRAELPRLNGITWTRFERGFCSTVHAADAATLYRQAGPIAAAAPVFRAELGTFDEADHPYRAGSVPWLRVLAVHPTMYQFEVNAEATLLSAAPELELVIEPSMQTDWIANRAADAPLTRLTLLGDHTAGLPFIQRVVEAAWAEHLETLELGTGFIDNDTGYYDDPTLGGPGAAQVAGAKLARVRRLDLTGQRVGADGIAAIVASMPALAELEVRHCEITHVGPLAALAGAPIVRLDLSDNTLGNAAAIRLAEAPRFARLESLAMALCEMRAPGLAAIAGAPWWSTLQSLDVSRNALGVDGMLALVEAAPPGRLHALSLADCDLDGEMLARIAALPWFAALDSLDLSTNVLGDCAPLLAAIAASRVRSLRLVKVGPLDPAPLAPAWARLTQLGLARTPIGDAGLAALVTDEESALVELDLLACKLTSTAIETLARVRCPHLRVLRLSGNAFDAAGLRALLHAPLMRTVAELQVSNCGMASDVIGVLRDAPELPALRKLAMRGIEFKPKELHQLADLPVLPSLESWLLEGHSWDMSDTSRTKLIKRFGPSWWWHHDDDEGKDDE